MSQDSCDANDEYPNPPNSSSTVQQVESPVGNKNGKQQTDYARPRWYKRTELWVAIFTGVLTIATILQWRAIISNHKATERAWVTVRGVTVQQSAAPGAKVPVVAGLRYSGNSPALQITIKHMLAIAPSLPPELKPKPGLPSPHGGSLGVMGPNSTGTSKGEYLVTAEDMINLVAGKAHFYSFGIIEYMDIFGTKHWTMFCYRSHALTDVDLVACSEWNEIDNN